MKVICDEKCACKQVTIDVINDFPKGLDVPDVSGTKVLPPVDVHLKLRPDCKNHILELYPDLFDGVGTMKHAMVKLDVDQAAIPVVQPPRKVPQAMIKPLKKEIERMEHLKVIQKLDINEATDWCHNLVLVHKPNGSLHVCLDPRTINNALRFNVHNSRTFQDITSSIRHVAKVSKIDANSGFWTLPMDANSQLLTMFNTPWGRYCFTKMPFGLNQAQYFFQFYMDQNFRDINLTTNLIADDVMVHGETEEEHNRNLLQVLNKCREIGLKLNPEKCIFGKPQVKFYGNIVGKDGLKADPEKVEAIVNLPVPTNKTEMSSFLGMCNYLAPFIPHLSDVTEPLRQLIKKATIFTWNESYDRAFRRAKLCVANAVTLRYFDPDKSITIECDASRAGIGGVH